MYSWINIYDVDTTLGQKVLIAGLQEAGKTAIKRIFFLRQRAVDVDNLKATIDYERMAVKISGVPITVVDLGGQRIFIKRFLSSFGPFIFNNVKIFIFVIDVSVKSTRNNSIQYFSNCVQRLQEYSKDVGIYVFLHKNDLVKQLPNYESIHEQLKEQFQYECPNKIRFFRTTIFEHLSVINAFGRIFELSIPSIAKSKFVDNQIIGKGEEYADKFAVLDSKGELCPNCKINLFDTEEGLRCNICDYFLDIKKVEIHESTQETQELSVKSLENQLNKIIIPETKTVNETQFDEEKVVSMDTLQNQLDSIIKNDQDTADSLQSDADIDIYDELTLNAFLPDNKSKLINQKDKKPIHIEEKEIEDPETITEELDLVEKGELNDVSEILDAVKVKAIESGVIKEEELKPVDVRDEQQTELKPMHEFSAEEIQKIEEMNLKDIVKLILDTGISVGLIRIVVFNFMKDIELSKIHLVKNKLLEITSAYVNGLIKEEEIINILNIANELPYLTFEELIWSNYPKVISQNIKKKEKEDLSKKSLKEDLLVLSPSENIGVQILIHEYQFELIFYQGEKKIDQKFLSFDIKETDLKYLFVFELDLPIKGDLKQFTQESTKLIMGYLKNLKTDQIVESKTKVIVKIETELTKLIETEDIFYKIIIEDSSFNLQFYKNEREFGKVEGELKITASKLYDKIRQQTLVPSLVDDDDLMFAVLEIFKQIDEIRSSTFSNKK
ncbi:MAG: ADP-ribosylation factor-like protein [Candidatus Hodarchaeales archaeon]|jgi:uncharacterized Zn finger protein (UPF0148 family)